MSSNGEEVENALRQLERKRTYNRNYYHKRVKPKRNQEKNELDILRKRCSELENFIKSTNIADREYYEKIIDSQQLEIDSMKITIEKLVNDNTILYNSLEDAQSKLHNLMMEKTNELLPQLNIKS